MTRVSTWMPPCASAPRAATNLRSPTSYRTEADHSKTGKLGRHSSRAFELRLRPWSLCLDGGPQRPSRPTEIPAAEEASVARNEGRERNGSTRNSAAARRRRSCRSGDDRPVLEMEHVSEAVRRHPGAGRRLAGATARRDPRAAGRKRRRQIDPDQDHDRHPAAGHRRDPRRRRSRSASPPPRMRSASASPPSTRNR